VRQVTFELAVELGGGCSFKVIPRRTVRECDLIGMEPFDKLTARLALLGCSYCIEDQPSPVRIGGNADFSLT
jgi:hypothetical protein